MSQPTNLGALPKTPPVNSPRRSDCPSASEHNSKLSTSDANKSEVVEKRRRPKRKWNASKKRVNKSLREKQMEDENLGIVAEALLSMKTINKELQAYQKGPAVCSKTYQSSKPGDDNPKQCNVKQHDTPVATNRSQTIHTSRSSSNDDSEVQELPGLFNNCIITQLNPLQKYLCDQNLVVLLKKRSVKHPKAEFVCSLCSYYCDTLTVVEKHISDRRHREALKAHRNVITMNSIPDPTAGQIVALTQLVEGIYKANGVTEEERASRLNIASHINSLVSNAMPECSVRLYGSSLTGMGLKKSDVNLDLVVHSELAPSKVLLAVNDLVATDERFRLIECNLNADLPAVVFVDTKTQLKCVLCLNNHNAYETCVLLAHYESIDKRVKPLAVMFRAWAAVCQIDKVDLGAWPPYAFSLLLIYYLQQMENPVLPVLHDLDQRPNPEDKPDLYLDPRELNGVWSCKNSLPVGDLWLGLLRFYVRDFAMSARVVCIQQLAPLKRSVKKWTGRKIAIEDPFLSKRNVSRTIVNMITFDFIMHCLQTTFKYYAIPQTELGAIFGSITKPHEPNQYGPDHEQIVKQTYADLEALIHRDPRFLTKNKSKTPVMQNQSELTVTPKIASLMYETVDSSKLVYRWSRESFCGRELLPIVCCMCRREGHTTHECPDEELPPIEPLPPITDVFIQYLTELCFDTYQLLSPNKEEVEERRKIVADIEDFLLPQYPKVKLELFGSSCNGFGLHKSDMDICFTFSDNATGKCLNFPHMIDELIVSLRKYKVLGNFVPITTAKVPILKFVHLPTKLEGDISVYNTLGQRNTKMLRAYANIDPRVTMLGFMIKKLAKLCDICDASRGSLSSYAYILMVIYFLQQCNPPVLPVLQQLHKPGVVPTPVMIEGCNTYFYEDIASLKHVWPGHGKNVAPVGLLWVQLLCFYTEHFDYKANVIAIKQIQVLPRFEKLWNTKSMAIEDPFDLTHNLGAGLSRKMHTFILKALIKVRTHFGTPVNLSDTLLQEYFFNKVCIVDGAPPNDRGCRVCKKIGHQAKDCPHKTGKVDAARGREGPIEGPIRQRMATNQRGRVPYTAFSNGLLPDPRRYNNGPNGHQQQPMYLGYQNGYVPPGFQRERYDVHNPGARFAAAPPMTEFKRLEMLRQTTMLSKNLHFKSRTGWQ